MHHTAYREISLQLEDIHDLFSGPEFDPFEANSMPVSGIEYLTNALKPSRLTERIRTIIFLPQDKIEPHVTVKAQEAVIRYCQHQIHAHENELASLRWQGIKALQSGILFLGACLLISTLAEGAAFLPEWIRRLAGEGFLIAGWVSLWHPIELFLYEWWPTWREIQVCKRLMEMEIMIEGAEVESASKNASVTG